MDLTGAKLSGSLANFGQGTNDLTNGNASISFDGGVLSSVASKPVNIDNGTGKVTLIPAKAADYSLTYKATSGFYSGFFSLTDGTNPTFKGMVISPGVSHGFFLSVPPAIFGASGESGSATLLNHH
jgi:hypothetical protein